MKEDKIREWSKEIPVPENLAPEKIEKKILEKYKTGAIPQTGRRTGHDIRRRTARIAVTAASVLVLLCAGGALLHGNLLFPESQTGTTASPSPDNSTSSEAGSQYETARKNIARYLEKNSAEIEYEYVAVPEESSGLTDEATSKSSSDSASAENYSGTNIQVEGVEEGDIVKTDGSCIYLAADDTFGSRITVYKADGASTKRISEISCPSCDISEMYLYENLLILIGADWGSVKDSESDSSSGEKTTVSVYDVTNAGSPKLVSTETQSGSYSHSRMNGKYLYTISNMTAASAKKEDDKSVYIPSVGGSLIPEADLCVPENGTVSDTYLVLTALDVTSPDHFTDSLAYLGEDSICYASESNIYIAAAATQSYDKTIIRKFSYRNGTIESAEALTFRGRLLNQFSMDEYKGNLRFVATTTSSGWQNTSNGLYVLNENMELIGKADRLAKSERIYSVRFLGDKAYFVTYRETDPVFLADLSNPENPVIEDELKLPGFSEYLHAFSDSLLLGIGSEVSDNGSRVKLSMFDISSDNEIKELHTKQLENGSYSIAGENHKAILVSPDKNLIGFAVETYNDDTGESDVSYRLYSYHTKKGFKKLGTLSPKHLELMTARGLYIEDYLYVADSSGLTGLCVYDMNTWKKVKAVS